MRVLLLSLVCLAAVGCQQDLIEPEFDVNGKTMVVIPFKSWKDGYFDSKQGIDLAKAITLRVKLNADSEELKMVSMEELEKLDEQQDIRSMSWEELATELGADYVCIGEISDFETSLATDIGLMRGKMRCEVQVLDATRNNRLVFNEEDEFRYPDVQTNEFIGYSTLNKTEADIERGLLASAARALALHFYSHFPDEAKKPVR